MFILLNNMNVIGIFVFLLAILQIKGQIESPCPKYFVFEPDKTDDDRWYGIITLTSRKNLNGLTVDLEFDKSIIQLGNWLGSVTSDRDNIRFTIKSSSKQIRANELLKIEIFVVYDPYYDVVPPKLLKIRLNGREICPNYEEEQEETVIFGTGEVDRPTILLNINVPTCGVTIATTVELITSGQTTKPGEYPWHAALYLKEGRKRKYLCGGSLISEQHVITAAHCTTVNSEARNPKEFIIILGKHTFSKQDSTEQHFTVIKIDVHEKFNKANFFNDISILHLNKPAEYTDYVRPICLWDEDISLNSVVNKTGTAVGFGRDHNENPNTEFLMQAQMPVVSQLQCIRSYPQYYGAFTTEEETNFCAGFRNGTSVCNGDSGGGLAFPKKGTKGANAVYQLRGIVSNTVSDRGVCDTDYYVIFTDVAKYLEWIAKIIKPS